MTRKRTSQAGSNSATAKLINKINKFNQNSTINNHHDSYYEQNNRATNYDNFYEDDDEVYILTTKQKQQLQRNEYLEGLTKEQLKIEAKRRGQKLTGTKSELVYFSLP
jgi:hypothetical protein